MRQKLHSPDRSPFSQPAAERLDIAAWFAFFTPSMLIR
jgi:hypothetical protein